jgi:hypothetical protein
MVMRFLQVLRNQWDRAAALVALVAAIVALVAGYLGVSRTAFFSEEIPYLISGGLTAMLLLGIAAVLYVSADLRDEWRELCGIHATLDAIYELECSQGNGESSPPRS